VRPDLVLEAKAWVRGAFQDVEIGLDHEAGKILAIKRNLPGTPRTRFPGKLLVPSGVDLHVHLRDPGSPAKEDFRSGTLGAALGGVGTVLDMPNTDPVVDRLSRFEEKRDRVASKACVDWGLWSTFTPQTTRHLDLAMQSVGVKLYLAPTTGIPEAGTAQDLSQRLLFAAKADRLVALHAETPPTRPPATLVEHDASRPAQGEVAAIEAAARAAPADAAVHVCHATTAQAARAASKAGWSAGATPHHLLLANDATSLGAFAKVNPPLRPVAERDGLWHAFAGGEVPILESDHAPHTREEKGRPFTEAPAGVPGVETMLPLLLHEARTRGLDAGRVLEAACAAPGRLLGLPKGQIEPGYDADFFAYDPRAPRKLRGSDLQSRCGWTPFEGREAIVVAAHYLHGDLVVEGGRFVGRAGRGRMVRAQSPPKRRVPEGAA